MKKIWKLLKGHLEADFNWKLYSIIGLFLGLSIFINYTLNLENGGIDIHSGNPIRIPLYFLLHCVAYFGVTVVVFSFNGGFHHFHSPRYWAITLLGILILSCNLGFPYLTKLTVFISSNSTYQLFRWIFGVTHNLINFLIQAIPLFVLAWFMEKKRENFGVNRNNIDLSPYWQILMVVAPLVIIASFEAGFKNYYPVYKRYEITDANNPTDIPTLAFALGFELAYGMDFFNVEFLFRGMMVIGVSQLIGKEAILPMVASYCFLHFGKPVGECISSIFGGYILGVVAFYTRNVWGGVIVHVGLAWMMEIMAFIHRAIN